MLSHREISSRSERLSACLARCLSAGRMPPVGEITEKIDEEFPGQTGVRIGTHRLAGLPAIPDLRPLSGRVINATSLFHVHTPSLLKH